MIRSLTRDIREFRRHLNSDGQSSKGTAIKKSNKGTAIKKSKAEDLCKNLAPAEHLFAILSDSHSAYYFHKFVTRKHSSETLSFWIAVEQFQTLYKRHDGTSSEALAEEIVSTYLNMGAPKEVNLDAEKLDFDIRKLSAKTFNCLQELAWNLLVTSDYPYYIKSKEYTEYMDSVSFPGIQRSSSLEKLENVLQYGLTFSLRPKRLSKVISDPNIKQDNPIRQRTNSAPSTENFSIIDQQPEDIQEIVYSNIAKKIHWELA